MLYFRLLQKGGKREGRGGVRERERNVHFHTIIRREVRTSSLLIYFAASGVE